MSLQVGFSICSFSRVLAVFCQPLVRISAAFLIKYSIVCLLCLGEDLFSDAYRYEIVDGLYYLVHGKVILYNCVINVVYVKALQISCS